eukprot:CAMPEP_0194391422 /NCGR_PEP_ID=MMETSP0174-20130528/115528_1 /TAXON_ID=216777 /ORGANISM="Proboscia alata, Strain PI-D3" /LENGTH=385 /DNA_ID=CAMNT_0039185727 /DNA_START=680 /DNA_END=1837 /DNA_ORIENTATION=+
MAKDTINLCNDEDDDDDEDVVEVVGTRSFHNYRNGHEPLGEKYPLTMKKRGRGTSDFPRRQKINRQAENWRHQPSPINNEFLAAQAVAVSVDIEEEEQLQLTAALLESTKIQEHITPSPSSYVDMVDDASNRFDRNVNEEPSFLPQHSVPSSSILDVPSRFDELTSNTTTICNSGDHVNILERVLSESSREYVRDVQNDEYKTSLLADREKENQRKLHARVAQEAQTMDEAINQSRESLEIRRLAILAEYLLPPPPESSDNDVATVAFRLPRNCCTGKGSKQQQRVIRRFGAQDSVLQLFYFLSLANDMAKCSTNWSLRSVLGGKILFRTKKNECSESSDDRQIILEPRKNGTFPMLGHNIFKTTTLKELGLYPRGLVIIHDEDC